MKSSGFAYSKPLPDFPRFFVRCLELNGDPEQTTSMGVPERRMHCVLCIFKVTTV